MIVPVAALATLLAAAALPATQPRPGACVGQAPCGDTSLILVGGHGGGSGGMGRASGGGMGGANSGGTTGGMSGTGGGGTTGGMDGTSGGTTGGMGGTSAGGMGVGGTGGLAGRWNDTPSRIEATPETDAATETRSQRQSKCVTPSGSCSFAPSSAAARGSPCHCAGTQVLGRFE